MLNKSQIRAVALKAITDVARSRHMGFLVEEYGQEDIGKLQREVERICDELEARADKIMQRQLPSAPLAHSELGRDADAQRRDSERATYKQADAENSDAWGKLGDKLDGSYYDANEQPDIEPWVVKH